ncbi:MAG: DsbA family protein [Nanoarchaeota archaeon]|nr:DsbA family protein [Nanoarchaeota archaeon]
MRRESKILRKFESFLRKRKIEKKELLVYTIIGVTTFILVSALFIITSNTDLITRYIAPSPQTPTQEIPGAGAEIDINVEDAPYEGNTNARVVMIEFSDYDDPFSEKFYSISYKLIKEDYINTGKIKFVHKDFALDFHENAQKAAEAARCFGEQGDYFAYYEKIFENQQSLSITKLKEWAEELDANTDQFDRCLDSGKMIPKIEKDFEEGQKYGVLGTPTFFINGKHIRGAQPFEIFQQLIEAELK